MSGLVIELQKACLDPGFNTAIVVQRAYVVARKLGIKEFEDWADSELKGYKDYTNVPDYRKVTGEVKVRNPYRGYIPVVMDDPKDQNAINNRFVTIGIGELETLATSASDGKRLAMPFTPEQERMILGPNSLVAGVKLFISPGTVRGIVDKVRHIILTWCLDLEGKGVVGEGMTFSEEEKKAAEAMPSIVVHYHGDVSQSQVGTNHSNQTLSSTLDLDAIRVFSTELRRHLSDLKIPADQLAQITADLSSIEAQLAAPKPSPGILREAFSSIRNIAEGAIGSLIASGILVHWPM